MKAPTDVAEVKPLLTVTSTALAVLLDGAVTVISTSLMGETNTELEPKLTELTDLRFVPLIVTSVPPRADPVLGETEVIVGAAGAV